MICHAVLLRIEGTCIIIVDRLPGSKFTNGSGVTADVVNADALCTQNRFKCIFIYFLKHQNKNDSAYVKEQIIVNILEKN